MRLSQLLEALPRELSPTENIDPQASSTVVRGITYDSRAVSPGDLFVALRGAEADGHDYLADALRLGATALLVEARPEGLDVGDSHVVCVPDTRRALAPISTAFFGSPSSELDLIGVTGTNGKTSTTYLLESILSQAGQRVGLIGTVEIRYANERERTLNTTPESLDLQRTLRSMRTRDVESVVMEVSSHGLELGRVDGCRFAVAAITNLTQEHLDFHGNMSAYRDSKVKLFRNYLSEDGCAVVNLDDPAADAFLAAATERGARIITTSGDADREADVVLESAEVSLEGTRARVRLPSGPIDVELPLLGDFNLENLRVALSVAHGLGIDPETMRAGVSVCPQVPGRIARVDCEDSSAPTVLVDYAHTPDAIEKLLRTVRPLTTSRLVTVFGCGGDRDRSKRPLMAEAVARWSDQVVATSDNPRSEDPLAILADVERGLSKLRRVEPEELERSTPAYCIEPDRRAAIARSIRIAEAGDIVVLAGKGHEDYQIIGRERLPFDDREEALRALAARNSE